MADSVLLIGNNTIQTGTNQIVNYVSWASIQMTNLVQNISSKIGINATTRWASMVTLFFAILIAYIGIKLTQPAIKWILILLGILILIGLIIPW